MRYFGHFQILQCLGPVAYRLALPEGAKIYLVYHVSVLKPYVGAVLDNIQPLLPLTDELGPIIQPEYILQARTILRNSKLVR